MRERVSEAPCGMRPLRTVSYARGCHASFTMGGRRSRLAVATAPHVTTAVAVATVTAAVAAVAAVTTVAGATASSCGCPAAPPPPLSKSCPRGSPALPPSPPPPHPPRPLHPPHTVLLLFRHGARAPVAPLTRSETWPWCAAGAYPRARPAVVEGIGGGGGGTTPPPPPPPIGGVPLPTGAGRGGGGDDECAAGQLTTVGAASAVALGEGLRAAYGPAGGDNGPGTQMDPRSVTVRSTPLHRTVDSAAFVLAGIFPATATGGGGGDGGGPVPDVPPIQVAPAATETLFPNPAACPQLADRLHPAPSVS